MDLGFLPWYQHGVKDLQEFEPMTIWNPKVLKHVILMSCKSPPGFKWKNESHGQRLWLAKPRKWKRKGQQTRRKHSQPRNPSMGIVIDTTKNRRNWTWVSGKSLTHNVLGERAHYGRGLFRVQGPKINNGVENFPFSYFNKFIFLLLFVNLPMILLGLTILPLFFLVLSILILHISIFLHST